MKRTLRREWNSIWNCIKGISKEEVWGVAQSRVPHAVRCTCVASKRWAIREHCKEPVGEVSTLWTYNPRRCALLRIVFNTANWRGAAAFLRFHCGLNSVAFYFGCGGIGRFEIVWNEAAARKSCIFKFFLLPRLVTRIKEFKIKESVMVSQTNRWRGKKLKSSDERIDRAARASTVHILGRWKNYFCSQRHRNF